MGRTEKIIGFLQVNSHGRVLLLTALCTAFTVAAAVCVVAGILTSIPLLPPDALIAIIAIAALIPMIITPPLAFILLHILRLLTSTIGHVDRQVRFDPMTGLYSRNYFLEKTRMMLDEGGAFLMVDADHFKRVNDTHGHAVGDEALKRFAQALRAGNKQTSLIGRLGGEEFGIFIPKGKIGDADLAAIRTSAANAGGHMYLASGYCVAQAANGGAVHEDGMALEDMIRLADERLYCAKKTGRNRSVLSDTPPIVPDFSDVEFWDEPATSAAA
jgi:diguanylate cyclase